MVEIFKTDVRDKKISKRILSLLNQHFPYYMINFDLDDCDKILRVESFNGRIDVETILRIVSESQIEIELLPD